jgi:hypothetical protein
MADDQTTEPDSSEGEPEPAEASPDDSPFEEPSMQEVLGSDDFGKAIGLSEDDAKRRARNG